MSRLTEQQLFLLLEKHHLGTCTREEEELLHDWFEQPTIIEELTFISAAEREQIRSEINAAILAKITSAAPAQPAISKRRKIWVVSAAAALLVSVLLFAAYYIPRGTNISDNQLTISAPRGINKMPVLLPDSSLVLLSGGSSIQYTAAFLKDARNITLTGTAYFSVRPDKNAPFTVRTDQRISVRVLGTSFLVKTSDDTSYVRVVHGSVQVDKDRETLGKLAPGEQLLYAGKDKTFLKKKYLPEEMYEWDDNSMIHLDSVSVSELAVLLHTMYQMNVRFDFKQTEHYRFKMSFMRDLPVDELLEMIHTVSGLKFERKGLELTITG